MANPSGRIVVSPIFVEVGALVTILFTYFVAALFSLVFVLNWQEVGQVMTYVVAHLVPGIEVFPCSGTINYLVVASKRLSSGG